MKFGPLSLILFCIGTLTLACFVPNYDHIKQTVSEIGEVGSPVQIPFTLLLIVIGICLLIFASTIRKASILAGLSTLVAILLYCMSISVIGVGIFAYPHPLHNVFGLSEMIGYQAPLALAITWRKHTEFGKLISLSWFFYAMIVIAIFLNLSPLFSMQIWLYIKPVHGLAQRFLFLSFFVWCAVVGYKLQKWPMNNSS